MADYNFYFSFENINMSIFEAAMLACFGISWFASVHKSIKARTSSGKSLFFLIIIWIGYVAGITHKVVYNFDIVIYLYILNALMVTLDIGLYVRNQKLDMQKGKR